MTVEYVPDQVSISCRAGETEITVGFQYPLSVDYVTTLIKAVSDGILYVPSPKAEEKKPEKKADIYWAPLGTAAPRAAGHVG
jgi:hypothetical protein